MCLTLLLSLRFHHPFHLMRHEGTFFAFKEDASRLQAFHIMPYILGDIYSIESILRAEHYTLYLSTIIIVGIHLTLPRSNTNDSSFVG